MTALEIVLVSLVGTLALVIILYFIVLNLFNKAMDKKVVDFKVLNGHAPENPIVFLGDSLTDFFPVHEFFHNAKIVNRGIANETTEDIFNRLDDIISLNPSMVILQAGVNDFLRKGIKNPQKVFKNIVRLYTALSSHNIECKLVSLYPINKKKLKLSWLYLRKVDNKKISQVNNFLRDWTKENNVEFIDLYPLLTDFSGNLNVNYTIEGLHLNLNGYNVIANHLATKI